MTRISRLTSLFDGTGWAAMGGGGWPAEPPLALKGEMGVESRASVYGTGRWRNCLKEA